MIYLHCTRCNCRWVTFECEINPDSERECPSCLRLRGLRYKSIVTGELESIPEAEA